MKLCGLANIGQTCYMNSLLQCLRCCDSFRDTMLRCKSDSTNAKSVAWALGELYDKMNKTKETVRPVVFLHIAQVHFEHIPLRQQNDIHEIFMMIVAQLCKELKAPAPEYRPENTKPTSFFDKLRRKCDKAWAASIEKEYSPLTDMLHGQMVAQIICGHCKHIHHNYQTFNVWEVPIVSDKADVVLEDCFLKSLESETLHEWRCDRCNEISPSEKMMKIWKFPRILAICLKRFVHAHRHTQKMNTPINVPENIDLYPLQLASDNASIRYNLKSAAIHHGSAEFGHYNAVCRNEGEWVCIDDESVTNASMMMANNGYMLFYERE